MSEWDYYKLGELAEIGSSKRIFSAEYQDKGVPFWRGKEITELGSGKAVSTELFISEEKYNDIKYKHGVPSEGDILVTSVGTIGNVYQVKASDKFYFKDGNVTWIKKFNPKISSLFLYKWFNSNLAKREINAVLIGSTQQALTISALKELSIQIPEKSIQVEIANIIDNLDQKITLLRDQNQTLEELAQTLFKRWFVEFEFPNENGQPYKSSGGTMIESELGEIPEGWRVAYLNTFISDSIGGDYGKEEPIGDFTEEATCLRGTDLPDMKTGLPERAPVRFIKAVKLKKCKLNNGDIVIEISGGTEGQSTGRAIYINDQILSHYSRPITCVNFCRILRTKALEFSYFTYLFLDFLYARGVFFNLENGSTGIKNLDLKTLLNDYELPIPPSAIVKQFDSSVNGIFKKIQENNKEIQSLTQLRDTLLPKLMSGELKINA